ncbi:ABC transporter substrate-binding protein [Candidatus Eisenbacteria bacterium]|uniref:ABC transporter substrate-binding protein n=1 Tax=Eiseniibacteriota bacterium TaxID=2212470 RepID=A0ABV6YL35_UNCEI
MRPKSKYLAVAAGVLMAAFLSAIPYGACSAQDGDPHGTQRTVVSVAEADSLPTYGNTPEELRPFGRFVTKPYKQFFVDPLEFTGPGREKPEPNVDSVVIGLLAPLKRSHEAYIGQPMLQAARLAIDEANAGGGYKGKPFKLVVRNDTGLWGASANEIVTFSYVDSAWAVIGTVDGANTHIAIRVALKTELPVINVADTDPTLVETKIPWIFRNIADDRQMAYTIAYHVYRERNFKRVAILRADNRYGRFGVGEFRSGSVRLKHPPPMEVNYEIAYNHVNPDFSIQMKRLKRVKPDAVVLWADAEAGGHLVRRMRAEGLDVPIFACDRVLSPRFLEVAGPAAEGVVAAVPFNPEADNPRLEQFRENFQSRYGAEPGVYAAHAYDGAWMTIDAIRKGGLNRYRIRDALAEITSYQGVTGEIVMDNVYADRGPVTLATVRNGHWVYNEPMVKRVF